MEQREIEHRYGTLARQRAVLWLGLSSMLWVALLIVIVLRWGDLTIVARVAGILGLISLFFTVRAQIVRMTFRCKLSSDGLRLIAWLGSRTLLWPDVVEVRRISFSRVGRQQRWACAILTRSKRGNVVPNYVFDDQLGDAEAVLYEIVRRTPQAEHVNI